MMKVNTLGLIKHMASTHTWAALTTLLLFFGCDSESANDCIQSAGTTIRQEITVPTFNRILVERDLNMVLRQDSVAKVVIETGENLMPDVRVKVADGQLQLINENDCNFFRDYGLTTIYVSS